MNVPEPVLAAMRRINELFNSEVVGKRNFALMDRVYTANARILPPVTPMVERRGPIKSFWQQAVAGMDVKSATLTTVDAKTWARA